MAFLFIFGNLATPLLELNHSDSTDADLVGKSLFKEISEASAFLI